MLLAKAEELAQELLATLQSSCSRIAIVGSIRRQRADVKDIDLLALPNSMTALDGKLRELGCVFGGPKIRRLVYPGDLGIPVDIYIATEETWATLVLIRTGSTRHNVRLCTRARSMNMRLKADGQGLLDARGNRVAGDTEVSIYEALGLRYEEPWERE